MSRRTCSAARPGRYHFGAPDYDPTTAWIQQGPINQIASLTHANHYTYAGGDPMNSTDLLGLSGSQGGCEYGPLSVSGSQDDSRGSSSGLNLRVGIGAGLGCSGSRYRSDTGNGDALYELSQAEARRDHGEAAIAGLNRLVARYGNEPALDVRLKVAEALGTKSALLTDRGDHTGAATALGELQDRFSEATEPELQARVIEAERVRISSLLHGGQVDEALLAARRMASSLTLGVETDWNARNCRQDPSRFHAPHRAWAFRRSFGDA